MDGKLPVALGIVAAAVAVVLVGGPSSAVRRPASEVPAAPPAAGCAVPLPTDGRPVSPVHRNGVSGR